MQMDNNAYTISISEEDAAVSASELVSTTSLTSSPVNISNVRDITNSSIQEFLEY